MIPGFFAAGAMGGAAPSGYPVYLSATPTGFPTAGTSHLVAYPATVNVGDLLIMQFGSAQGGTGSINSEPSGWNLFAKGLSNHRWGFFWKIASGSEGGTSVAVGMSVSSRAAAIVHRIQAGTFDAASTPAYASATALSSQPNPPTVSPSWGAASNLWLMGYTSFDGISSVTYPYPTGNSFVRSDPVSTGTAYAAGAACWTEDPAGTLDPGVFTKSVSSSWRAFNIAIKPP